MKVLLNAVLVAIAAAVSLTSVAAAGQEGARQQVEITAKGVANPSLPSRFVLTPYGAGALEPDSGTETAVVAKQRTVTRDGQTAQIVTWISTCKGKRGSFVVRSRMEYVDAGNGYLAGTNTWEFVRGTGQYAQITGGGRGGDVVHHPRWSDNYEGFLTTPTG